MLNKPILFIVFNRIDTTRLVFEEIRKVKPKRLYISADGPRKELFEERIKCKEVRDFVTNIDWDCELKIQFFEDNLGCKLGVYNAIDWFFKNEESGIILEDDVVPNQSFFQFCSDGLKNFESDKNIFAIQGFNQFGQKKTSNGYYLSKSFYAWGWASWRDRWNEYKLNLNKSEIKKIYNNKTYPKYVLDILALNLDLIEKKYLDTWDYQMVYQVVINDYKTVVPGANLVSNVGVNGAHSNNNKNINHDFGELKINKDNVLLTELDSSEFNTKIFAEFKDAYFGMMLRRLILKFRMYGLFQLIKSIIK